VFLLLHMLYTRVDFRRSFLAPLQSFADFVRRVVSRWQFIEMKRLVGGLFVQSTPLSFFCY